MTAVAGRDPGELYRTLEDVYKLSAESFRGRDHLHRIQTEARDLVAATFTHASPTGC